MNNLSKARKREWKNPIIRAKRIASMRGHKMSKETREKISKALKGRSITPQTQFKRGHKPLSGWEKGAFKKGHKTLVLMEKRPRGERHYNWIRNFNAWGLL